MLELPKVTAKIVSSCTREILLQKEYEPDLKHYSAEQDTKHYKKKLINSTDLE